MGALDDGGLSPLGGDGPIYCRYEDLLGGRTGWGVVRGDAGRGKGGSGGRRRGRAIRRMLS